MRQNRSLDKGQRKIFTERLLKLHEIIADSPAQYDHSIYKNHCGTAACAVGHAMLFEHEFPGFKRPNGNHNIFDYFGPGSYAHIFSLDAYDKPAGEVTRQDALRRIREYITKVLGCRLIPADAPPTFREKLRQFAARFS